MRFAYRRLCTNAIAADVDLAAYLSDRGAASARKQTSLPLK